MMHEECMDDTKSADHYTISSSEMVKYMTQEQRVIATFFTPKPGNKATEDG